MKKYSFLILFSLLGSLVCFGQMQIVEWKDLVGVQLDIRTNALVKTAPDGWGNAGAYSTHELPATTDGYVEFNLQDRDPYFALGLSSANIDNHYGSMDHGFFFERGAFYIVDAGRVVGQFGTYQVGDAFKIERFGNASMIGYFYNNVKVFESGTNPAHVLHADLSLFSHLTLLNDISVNVSWMDPNSGPGHSLSCGTSDDYNWVESTTYDLEGNIISESKVFADKFGKPVQSQVKNRTEDEVFASQPMYDVYGRAVAQTLSAPINKSYFCIAPNFVTNDNEDVYDYTDFDLENTSTSSQTGQVNNPKRVNDDHEGTLGWYYSNNNTDEAYVDNTDYPYSRVEYSKSNPGQVRRSSSAGNELRMGKGHESENYVMSASSELYYVYGYSMDWNTTGIFGSQLQPINMDYQVVKTISVDQDEKEYVSFTDHDGKVLATCRSGLSNPLQTVESLVPNGGHVDIHLPKECETSLAIHYPTGANNANVKLRILDLSTDQFIDNGGTTLFSVNEQPNLPAGYYRIEHASGGGDFVGISLTYQLNYERFTLHYYDQGKRLVRTIPPLGIDESYQPGADLNVWSGNTMSCTTISQNSLSVNQPSNLQVQSGQANPPQQVAHVSLWGAKLLDPSDLISGNSDPISVMISNNGLSSSLRMSNLAAERAVLKRNDHFISGGLNGKGLLAFTTKIKKLTVDYTNVFFNNALNSSVLSFQSLPINTTSSTTNNSGANNTQQTYDSYDVHYKLGYRKNGVFITAKDNLIIRFRKNTQHTVPGVSNPVGNTQRFVTYVGGDNSTLVTDFVDLSKYEAQITHVETASKVYITSGAFAGQYVTSTGQITDISTISNLQYFGLRLHVENISQSKEPNHLMAQTYKFNSLNWLLETHSDDEGTSKFVYRDDGQIRFSQNARQLQESAQRFSYTNYDKYARPIESGEHKGSIPFSDHYADGTGGNQMEAIREYTGGFSPTDPTCSQCIDKSYIYYDIPRTDVPVIAGHNNRQRFTSGNITKTENQDVATWYSYDHYGRITWMIKSFDLRTTPVHKLWMYEYDNRGNVSQVIFQPYSLSTTRDYFAHEYIYDANNRLSEVKTSRDGTTWIKQAHYIYYPHGPLKRVELRDDLQGIDYVYTINGALKSINNPDMDYDPGNDSPSTNSFDSDVFAMTLDYFSGDYRRNNTGISDVKEVVYNPNPGTSIITESNYSGSIKAQHWNDRLTPTSNEGNQEAYLYAYDDFNQLKDARFASFRPDQITLPGVLSGSENFRVSGITYDKNGNLRTLVRKDEIGAVVDNLKYNYVTPASSNRLTHVDDDDSEDQDLGDLIYDASGRLKKDLSEDVEYFYNTQGLVIGVQKESTGQDIIKFYYDDGGFRYKKEHYSLTTGDVEETTLYVRDASGQVTSIYNKPSTDYEQIELAFYGSSRIGTLTLNDPTSTDDDYNYELKDHLGNVRQVIRVRGVIEDWAFSKANYYPFGMKFMNINSYRYGYQGEYAEDETGEDGIKANSFQLRLYNPRLGRWLSPDPYGQYHSPYLAMGNSPTGMVDPDGGYSKFGYWWRNGFSMKGAVYGGKLNGNGRDVYGFTEFGFDSDGDWGFTTDFGSDSHGMANTHNYFSLNGVGFLSPKSHGSIEVYKPNFFGNIQDKYLSEESQTNGLVKTVGNIAYSIVDDATVYITSLNKTLNEGTGIHLNGKFANRNELESSGLNTFLLVTPTPLKNTTMISKFNVATFGTAFKGTFLTKLAPATRGVVIKSTNKVIQQAHTKRFVSTAKSQAEKIKNK